MPWSLRSSRPGAMPTGREKRWPFWPRAEAPPTWSTRWPTWATTCSTPLNCEFFDFGPSKALRYSQGRALVNRLGTQRREKDDVADRRGTGQEHRQAVDADPQTRGRGKSIIERPEVIGDAPDRSEEHTPEL